MAKDGAEVPLTDYTRELRLGPHVSHDWIVNDLVFSYYQRGATIVLQMLQNSLPAYGPVANRLEQFFGANIQASCFITPPNSQGFTAHYDTYSFFAVQLFGSKEWALYDSRPELPIRDDREDEEKWTPVPPTQQLLLNEGDVLFVPRGLYHSARASAVPSIHLTIGIFAPNWSDALKASIRRIGEASWLRDSVRTSRGVDNTGFDEAVVAATARVCDALDLANGVDALREEVFSRHVDARQNRLLDLLNDQWSTSQLYRRQAIPFELRTRGERAVLRFANKEIDLPLFVRPVLAAIPAEAAFAAADLPDLLDDDSRQRLLRRLLAEGFIRTV